MIGSTRISALLREGACPLRADSPDRAQRTATTSTSAYGPFFAPTTQVANTEAVHFDLFADVDYEALRTEPHGWSGAVDGRELEVAGDIVAASIRQIAWEVDATLDAQCGTLLGAE